MKIILNKCYGGFGVSTEAYQLYARKKGFELYPYIHIGRYMTGNTDECCFKKIEWKNIMFSNIATIRYFYLKKDYGDKISEEDFEEIDDDYIRIDESYRTDPVLIDVVEELGVYASGLGSKLIVVDIPDDLDYVIDKKDGFEVLHQRVQTW